MSEANKSFRRLKRVILVLIPALIFLPSVSGQDFSPLSQRKSLPSGAKYADRSLSPAERAKDLIAHMTFQEKLEMTGNNLVNGIPCSMNKPLMADILRKEYGFTGIAMTDWQTTTESAM